MEKKNLKAVLMLGGKGTRLKPLTNYVNKHEICIGGKSMIEHALDNIIAAGIKDISVTSGDNYSDPSLVDSILQTYSLKDPSLTFNHTKESTKGTADGARVMKQYLKDSYYINVFGDVLYENTQELKEYVEFFKNSKYEGMLLLASAPHPERHATPIIEDEKIIEIIEKHQNPPTNLVVTTWGIYPPQALDYVEELSLSERGELEISDLRTVVLRNHPVGSINYKGWWIDAGVPVDLIRANALVLSFAGLKNHIDPNSTVTNSELNMSTIKGNVRIIDSNLNNVIVQGDITITNATLENCVLMGNVVLDAQNFKNRISFNEEFAYLL